MLADANPQRPAEERGKRWLGERVTPNEREELQKAKDEQIAKKDKLFKGTGCQDFKKKLKVKNTMYRW